MQNYLDNHIITILNNLRDRIKNNKDNLEITPAEVEEFLDSWNSWVILKVIKNLGGDLKQARKLDTYEKAIAQVKSDNEGDSYIGVIMFMANKNKFYKNMLINTYFQKG
ncbi:hypothetical protein [uncultured Clostridium sp.]|uniref:hypothetical protein n=1 Tax=uncultured Clostridium sp. TaxID=59620 RepID=UPI0026F3FDBC|nr:hypothetical protein [uncultured Clostridium sp.]